MCAAKSTARAERKLELFELLYERHLQKYGRKHEATLRTANALGASHINGGRVEESLPLLERTHKLADELLGPDHLETAQSLLHLSHAYLELERTDEAITTSRKAVAGLVKILGPENIWSTLHAKRILALALQQNGAYEEADTIFLDIADRWKGKPPSTAIFLRRARDDLTLNYMLQGKFAEAEGFWKTLAAESSADEGPIDPLTKVVAAVEEYTNAEDSKWSSQLDEQFSDFLATRADADDTPEKFDDPAMLERIGSAHLRAGRWQQAIDLQQRVIDLRKQSELSVGATTFHINVARARSDQAMAAFELGETEQARRYLHEAESALGHTAFVDEANLAEQSARIRETARNLNEARRKLGQPTEFTNQERIDKALQAQIDHIKAYPEDSNPTMTLLVQLAWFGRQEQRLELGHQALDRLKDPKNPDDARAHSRIARGCLIAPTSDQQLLDKAVASARLSVTQGFNNDTQQHYRETTLAMAEYRSGDYAKAEEVLTAAIDFDPEGKWMGNTALLFRSMTRHHLGRQDEARADLDAVAERILPLPSRDHLPADAFASELHFALVYEEAKALLNSRPASNAEVSTSDSEPGTNPKKSSTTTPKD